MNADAKRPVSQRELVKRGCRYPPVDVKVTCELDIDGD